ncbi:uncharacterized protein [Miscanthus floridulus]|uniref:uncharacterized protein n=1 Tax=Miscanthus floridulus TaxID=154761 RepID=UPI0034599366
MAGTMPRLNRVFEELRIVYREREVPTEVLASIDKKKKASVKNVTAEAESKKRKGASVARAPVKKKMKSVALVMAAATSSAGRAGVASTGSEDIQSSSVPSVDVRVMSSGDRSSPGAPVRPVCGAVSGAEQLEASATPARLLHDAGSSAERSKAGAHPSRSSRGAVGGAERPEASAAPARSLHGAASVTEQPEASAADPMPDIFGGLYSSSKEGAEVVLQHAPSSPTVVAPSPMPEADVGQPEVVLAEQALAAQSSLSPPPARPRAKESQPFGPSPHDREETSAQGARQVAQPGLFMSDVMAGLLTPEERAAAASVRFGPGQPGPMAPVPSSSDTSILGSKECYLGVLGDVGGCLWQLGYHTAVVMEERCTHEISDRDTAIEALKVENKRLEGENGGLANSLAALRLSLVEKEQEKEALRADLAKARDAGALSAEQARTGGPRVSGESWPLRRNSQLRWGAAVFDDEALDSVKGVLAANR